MQDPNAQRRNQYSQHDRHSEQQQPYPRQAAYGRNHVTNAPTQNGSWGYRGQKDHFNNWNTRNDTWKQRGAVPQYGRPVRLENGDAVGFGERNESQIPLPGPSRSQSWDNRIQESVEEPIVDEWGREIRRRQDSVSSEDGNREYDRSYSNGEHRVQSSSTFRGHYERPQKRQHSSERENYRPRYNSTNQDFGRTYVPPINKKPRLDPVPNHHHGGWSKQSTYYPPRNHSPEHTHYPPSESFAEDPNQFEVPLLSNSGAYVSTVPPAKGHYSRKPAFQEFRQSPAFSNIVQARTTLPESLSRLPPTTPTPTIPASRPPFATPNQSPHSTPNKTSPISKTSKSSKSALVKQFFFDDEDEDDMQIPGLPPQEGIPSINAGDSADYSVPNQDLEVLSISLDKSRPSSPESKHAVGPVLPLSPVSKSPPTPLQKGGSPQEVTMDISPIDNIPPVIADNNQSPKETLTGSQELAIPAPAPVQLKEDGATPTAQSKSEPFEFLSLVGIGAYGKVFKAKEAHTGRLVALKKIKTESQHDGFPVTALREIKLLQGLHHENMVALQEIVTRKGSTFLKFEYVEHDLAGLLHQSEFRLLPEHIKSLTKQLCEGLAYVHSRYILHRDLKPANLLVTSQGTLKLGDFGLARVFNKRKKVDYTNRVCTYWYRAPELMLGETIYGPEIDMWSAGCIFMEMFLRRPPFCAEEEVDQLHAVYSVLGTPNENYAPQLLQKTWYTLLPPPETCENVFREKYSALLPEDALDFVGGLLHMDGSQRPSPNTALESDYFTLEPTPVSPDLTVITTDWHEYEYQTRKRKERYAHETQVKAGTSAASQKT